jgi:hypothetical protein
MAGVCRSAASQSLGKKQIRKGIACKGIAWKGIACKGIACKGIVSRRMHVFLLGRLNTSQSWSMAREPLSRAFTGLPLQAVYESGFANTTPCRLRCRNHWRRRHFTASARPLLIWPLPATIDFTTLATEPTKDSSR